jgi:hypothetical protein
MQSVGIHDSDLLGLAEDTVGVAEFIDDVAIFARLHEIARERRKLAVPAPDRTLSIRLHTVACTTIVRGHGRSSNTSGSVVDLDRRHSRIVTSSTPHIGV